MGRGLPGFLLWAGMAAAETSGAPHHVVPKLRFRRLSRTMGFRDLLRTIGRKRGEYSFVCLRSTSFPPD